jgi:hypothetical protein
MPRKKTKKYDSYRFKRDFFSLLAPFIFFLILSIYSAPSLFIILISLPIIFLLTLWKASMLIADYKRRGFINPIYPWEDKYMDGVEKHNKRPEDRITYGILSLIIAIWLGASFFKDAYFFDQSIKLFSVVLTILFLETLLVSIIYRKEIYKIKK